MTVEADQLHEIPKTLMSGFVAGHSSPNNDHRLPRHDLAIAGCTRTPALAPDLGVRIWTPEELTMLPEASTATAGQREQSSPPSASPSSSWQSQVAKGVRTGMREGSEGLPSVEVCLFALSEQIPRFRSFSPSN